MKDIMTGYAAVIMGIAIIMFTIAATSMGATIAVARSAALLAFGGFIAAWGFLTAGCFSNEPSEVRAGLIIAGAITILATILVI